MKAGILKLILLICIVFINQKTRAEGQIIDSNLKARFLYTFISFTEWPEKAFVDSDSAYKIGILGDGAIVKLYQTMKRNDINGREIHAESLPLDYLTQDLSRYQILFVRESHKSHLAKLQEVTKDLPILVISENINQENQLSMINFIKLGNKVRFAINNENAKSAGIKFRSQLLKVATKVM